ncbi:AfsR/SARP family transcriptional regulator [Longispora albida]|uniref:AfsR/SARP family transcriptional regulator n=1 Tax=Longispora albida TaxID=203523 RepID=UPI00036B91B4|nr:BTAD domain-containing putative transcriptional regulator [Longispora albida]
MWFGVLGPVEASSQGVRLPPLAPRHRAVLGYFLLHAGKVLSAERVIGAVWGENPPDTVRTQLQGSVSAIRRALAQAGAPDMLVTRSPGYVLDLGEASLDLLTFTELAGSADPVQLRAALALWRGQAFADITAGYVDSARARLRERRLVVLERMADLELAAGSDAELVDELAAAVDEDPARERLAGQLMLALYRAGRQPEALEVARRFRAALADQQGLSPGADFTRLEQRVLRTDPELRLAPKAGDPSVPAQLPADLPDFTGRTGPLELLDGVLPDYGRAAPSAVLISTIAGIGGVGKTDTLL